MARSSAAGTPDFRIFTVDAGASVNSSDSRSREARLSGGGIDNAGTLTVVNSTITGNSPSGTGGGIDNRAR